ncbi:MAG: helix-turn-helix domain-containing protein [Pseudonocardiaceae bacterium]
MSENSSLRMFVAMPVKTMGKGAPWGDVKEIRQKLLAPAASEIGRRLGLAVELVIEDEKKIAAHIPTSMFAEASDADVYIADLTGFQCSELVTLTPTCHSRRRSEENMDDQAQAIGRRVRYWRERRNLDRQRFADMVGRSTSWVDKIEKGERLLLRLPMLERVAAALSIDPTALTDSSAAQRAIVCVDAVEVRAIRAALGRYPSVAAPDTDRRSATLNTVEGQLTYVEHAWLSSHFTVVSQHLPRLLGDAQVVVLATSAADQAAAHRALVAAYRLASSMLLKFNANDIAWLAADRAMHTALAVDDTVALARATRSVARKHSALSLTCGFEVDGGVGVSVTV